MRKRLIGTPDGEGAAPAAAWIEVEQCAHVELTSEDPAHPIESALRTGPNDGWRAASPGEQVIRIRFDEPMRIRRIHLAFREREVARTQEFSLRWSGADADSREVLRQQYTFSPPTTTTQIEDYTVELDGVTELELVLVPDVAGGEVRASLERWLLA